MNLEEKSFINAQLEGDERPSQKKVDLAKNKNKLNAMMHISVKLISITKVNYETVH